MGDIAPDLPLEGLYDSSHEHREIRVLVTGYAPFHMRYPVNASWSIASTLPAYLPATPTSPRIKLIVPPKPITVAYKAVLEWQQQWMSSQDYDIVLHIGLAAGRKFFTLERQSMREPYWQKEDVTGQVFSREATEKLWPASNFPAVLKPTFDSQDVWLRWRDNVSSGLDVRPSDDPGNYLCGFIYYSSMAWYMSRGSEERPVMFLHVPDLPSEELVAGGREVAIGLIRALVDSRERKGIFDPLKGDVSTSLPTSTLGSGIAMIQEEAEAEAADASSDPELAWTYRR
jgi:pyroglutamyl-peptidase